MTARSIVAAALVLVGAPAFASDATADRREGAGRVTQPCGCSCSCPCQHRDRDARNGPRNDQIDSGETAGWPAN